jgi:deazaflavin-dependent oxidoreductase (nitroreductase family)
VTQPTPYERAPLPQRLVRRAAASGPGSWLLARVAHRADAVVLGLTGGRSTLTSVVSGLPVVVLTTTGARSGRPRAVPLVALPTSEGLAVIASSYGSRAHPAWYHNLLAHPEAVVSVDGVDRAVTAVLVGGDRRRRIWEQALRVYPGYGVYERRAAGREIGVFLLT